jgi:hypothetical protein
MSASDASQGLYPIIRRARRPLVIQDDDSGSAPVPAPPVPVGQAEPAVSYAKRVRLARQAKHAAPEASEQRA